MSASAAVAVWLLLSGGQGSNTGVDQIDAPAGSQAAAAEQISKAGAGTDTNQIGKPSREVPAATPTKRSSTANQLMVGKPSAAAPASGSTPQQGRNTHTDVVQGSDRCDPAAGKPADDACKQVIETRSAEFKPPEPTPLTPEQNLMISQQAQADIGRDVALATRRLANGDVDNNNVGAAMSSLVVTAPPSDAVNPAPEADQTTQAIISTVIGVLQGQ